jgi:RNA polymerase sigma factor (sigma-70 family)
MLEHEASDDVLMQAVANGDAEAFRTLLERHQGWVYSLIDAVVRNEQHAEDLTQEVFWRLHQHAGSYIGKGEFVAWLKRIALNRAKDFLRQQKRSFSTSLEAIAESVPDDDCSDPASALLTSAVREELRAVIGALPDEQRLVIIMRYFGDMSLQDIAWAMKCPLGTVKSRLFNGLRRIQQALSGPENNEGGPSR